MTRARILVIGTAFAAFAAFTATYAQTTQPDQTMQPAPGAAMQAQPVTPPQNMVAPAPTDPLVQKRNANAQANAEYHASKKASKAELKASNKQAKEQYKEEVSNAKINRKADKAELNEVTDSHKPKDASAPQ
ncbi:hypothetical protein BHUM_03678 [Candidatus Burkholderia humilis]|nr:hypothetical protein BHUM_03678 [Candidatus Burkholderia humilis]